LALFYNGFSILLIPTHFWIRQRASVRPDGCARDLDAVKISPVSSASQGKNQTNEDFLCGAAAPLLMNTRRMS
jgi:hypothetical protein